MASIQQLLRAAHQQLADVLLLDSREARNEARMLLSAVLAGVSHAWLISHDQEALTAPQQAAFDALLQRRLAGEPIAYILEQREFYGLALRVTADTLIPRTDTETLVEAALAKIPATPLLKPDDLQQGCQAQGFQVLDLGTGTGAIALAIAQQRPQVQVTAVDASAAALNVAQHNALQLGLANVRLLQSDWFSALNSQPEGAPDRARFHLIVSNPPYIAAGDPHLTQGDLRFEPMSALASGADGLDDIRHIVAQAPHHLVAGGWLMLEHGYDQADAVAGLMKFERFTEISHANDLAGHRRVTAARTPSF
ncbi:peptide chain release factor N(5)-glutamine methyltransferase [Pseudomethylobacillus aquaticus]|uniref:Release factor glutamine methyltransferase n=1 Tax=Pseudomethylobacillus aquaticus TaxID=2676064 RepID=A0A3N0V422_9PROT|nr:peptide chain release factor N(5)-glutamine methyltransferase [Pseudomethylobacillus aquaticus]ROH87301.1 peptide chain release factor N(5)-glutamine methyltransferase [Pseudomethylobacillus aquaticus]